jgi:hypothetical protein
MPQAFSRSIEQRQFERDHIVEIFSVQFKLKSIRARGFAIHSIQNMTSSNKPEMPTLLVKESGGASEAASVTEHYDHEHRKDYWRD